MTLPVSAMDPLTGRDPPALLISGVSKTFTMHLRGGVALPVLTDVSLALQPGTCVALTGPSGSGKSTLLRIIFANYRADRGRIQIRHDGKTVDLCVAEPRTIIDVRRRTLGYVSQFLRVIPRVSALEIVSHAGREAGLRPDDSDHRAAELLRRLNLPERLWTLAPATFSGGEQQRVNIARGLIGGHAVLLIDEPTASLDALNRSVVIELLQEAKQRSVAILGIFHDAEARAALADRDIDITQFTAHGAARRL
jgi:alpha-D-ribose 1-methylphosphonate 5-triphosphate synthase subunit PhnL